MPADGTYYAPGHEPLEMPPMQVKYWDSEQEKSTPGNKVSELVRVLISQFKMKE